MFSLSLSLIAIMPTALEASASDAYPYRCVLPLTLHSATTLSFGRRLPAHSPGGRGDPGAEAVETQILAFPAEGNGCWIGQNAWPGDIQQRNSISSRRRRRRRRRKRRTVLVPRRSSWCPRDRHCDPIDVPTAGVLSALHFSSTSSQSPQFFLRPSVRLSGSTVREHTIFGLDSLHIVRICFPLFCVRVPTSEELFLRRTLPTTRTTLAGHKFSTRRHLRQHRLCRRRRRNINTIYFPLDLHIPTRTQTDGRTDIQSNEPFICVCVCLFAKRPSKSECRHRVSPNENEVNEAVVRRKKPPTILR